MADTSVECTPLTGLPSSAPVPHSTLPTAESSASSSSSPVHVDIPARDHHLPHRYPHGPPAESLLCVQVSNFVSIFSLIVGLLVGGMVYAAHYDRYDTVAVGFFLLAVFVARIWEVGSRSPVMDRIRE